MIFRSSITPSILSRSLEADGNHDLEIDLSDAPFIEPAGLVGIAAIIEDASAKGRTIRFAAPRDFNVANYVSRMQLADILDSFNVSHDIVPVNANALKSELLELSRFEGQSGGEALAELVFNKVKDIGADPSVLTGFYEAICEVTGNVYFHADVDHGYVAAQSTHGGSKIRFGISDAGVGMKSSLRKSHTINDDAQALTMSIQPFVSGTGDPNRGQGLSAVVSTTQELRGSIELLSGTARLAIRDGGIPSMSSNSGPFPGTLIQVELDCHPRI